jgi:hypothetical protein
MYTNPSCLPHAQRSSQPTVHKRISLHPSRHRSWWPQNLIFSYQMLKSVLTNLAAEWFPDTADRETEVIGRRSLNFCSLP